MTNSRSQDPLGPSTGWPEVPDLPLVCVATAMIPELSMTIFCILSCSQWG